MTATESGEFLFSKLGSQFCLASFSETTLRPLWVHLDALMLDVCVQNKNIASLDAMTQAGSITVELYSYYLVKTTVFLEKNQL